MTLRIFLHPIVAATSFLLTIGNLHADVVQILNFSVTTFTQSPISDSGDISTAATPKVSTHKTADLLQALAQDEFAAGKWPSNSFPATAKLATSDNGFFVINGTNVLVSVTNVMSFEAGENNIYSGKRNNTNRLALPSLKRLQIGRITFDDTSITGGSNLKFYIQGLITDSQTDTTPNATGIYTESQSGKMTNGAGEGVDSDGSPFVLTGTVTVAGKATLQLPP